MDKTPRVDMPNSDLSKSTTIDELLATASCGPWGHREGLRPPLGQGSAQEGGAEYRACGGGGREDVVRGRERDCDAA